MTTQQAIESLLENKFDATYLQHIPRPTGLFPLQLISAIFFTCGAWEGESMAENQSAHQTAKPNLENGLKTWPLNLLLDKNWKRTFLRLMTGGTINLKQPKNRYKNLQ